MKEDINGPIDVNISFAEMDGILSCRVSDIDIHFTEEEKRLGIPQSFYDGLNDPILGHLTRNRIWFLGSDSDVTDFINGFSDRFEKDIEMSDSESVNLSLRRAREQGVVETLLNKQLACVLAERGFIVDHRRKTAFAGPKLVGEATPPLVHEERFFECFRYRVVAHPAKVSLQMDPVIRILDRKTPMEINEFLLPFCSESKCPNLRECIHSLPRSIVFYRGDSPDETADCPSFETASRVYDPWTAQDWTIPKKALFGRVSDRSLYIKARTYALKSPEQRWRMTNRFFNLLSTDETLSLRMGDGNLRFNSPFTTIPIVKGETRSYAGYARAGEVPLVFGPEMRNVDPFQGLKRFGSYSHNTTDPGVTNPDFRVFAVYPEKMKTRIEDLLERLKNGRFNYPGFDRSTKPFGTGLEYLLFPIEFSDADKYTEMVKARIDNLRIDYPIRAGDVLLIVIPENSGSFYFQIKDFATARNLKTQMLQSTNIDSVRSQWYNLYCFALSLYVNGGTTPWKIDSSYFDQADCYVGLAFSVQKLENGGQRFFVGVADVFDAFGEHLSFALHEGTIDSSIKGLHVDRQFMHELVSQSILRYIDKMEKSPSTLLIHKPGRFLRDEVAGVSDALLEHESDRALLVHVQHNSLFRAYNSTLNYQPVATTYFRIGPGHAIVLPTGYLGSSLKDHKMGCPRPVQLNMKWVESSGSTSRRVADDDLHFAIQNYLAFTRLRWSSLSPRIRDPITIHAPRVVAEWQSHGVRGLDGLDIRDVF